MICRFFFVFCLIVKCYKWTHWNVSKQFFLSSLSCVAYWNLEYGKQFSKWILENACIDKAYTSLLLRQHHNLCSTLVHLKFEFLLYILSKFHINWSNTNRKSVCECEWDAKSDIDIDCVCIFTHLRAQCAEAETTFIKYENTFIYL